MTGALRQTGICGFVCLLVPVCVVNAKCTFDPQTGISVQIGAGGSYSVRSTDPPFYFAGSLKLTPAEVSLRSGSDRLGFYREVAVTIDGVGERAIRLYTGKRVVVFSAHQAAAAPNEFSFPTFTVHPRNLSHVTYKGIFALHSFVEFGSDSPWIFFDQQKNTYVLSPASHFNAASTEVTGDGAIRSGIDRAVSTLPADFSHEVMLVVGKGINATIDAWGKSLTDYLGKRRSANDSETLLEKLGYWTDAGASYYYKFDVSSGYAGTLLGIKKQFDELGISLGYMQLDSWFYPKGINSDWTDYLSGISRYEGDRSLFKAGLPEFQRQLGIPLATHARWLDPTSPYRAQYKVAGNVATDELYWNEVSRYLQQAGVSTYEQDWLATRADAPLNLNDRRLFLGNMAKAMRERGITVQYCMPSPRHFLFSAGHDNITTIRTSEDRFQRSRWDDFLLGSRFAAAVGLWPWSDVFMSSETENLLISTLSAGPVGVGDALGTLSGENLLRAARPDGVVVKPDTSALPVDGFYLTEGHFQKHPMIAAAQTRLGDMTAAYVLTYLRSNRTTSSFTPESAGVSQSAYVYDYFRGEGRLYAPDEAVTTELDDALRYYVVAPVGASGIALIGDPGHFVTLGRKRVTDVIDNGVMQASVLFAPTEVQRTLIGYSPSAPAVSAVAGAAALTSYDEGTHLFRIAVAPGESRSAAVRIAIPERSAATR